MERILKMNSNKDILNLGQLVSMLRKEKGYSQRKFAQVTGLSNATISRIENGETQYPASDTIKLLAAHLDCDEAELFKLISFHSSNEVSHKHAKLIFLQQPVKAIKRYSTVSFPDSKDQEISEGSDVEHTQSEALQPAQDMAVPVKMSLKGMRLITLRLEKNITQKELADTLKIDKTLISQYEGEILQPDYQTLAQIAGFFGVTMEYLTGSAVLPMQSYTEPQNTIINMPIKPEQPSKDIKQEYLLIAEEIQNADIDIKDVRAFIEMLKKYKQR
jgi:transcriptional regulator with XRE-family HTH domain